MTTEEIVVGKNTSKSRLIKIIGRVVTYFVISALVVAGILYFNAYLPQGKGPASPPVPAREEFSYFQRLVQNPPGDSPDMMGKNLSKVFPNLTNTNTASSWSTSINHLEGLEMTTVNPQDVMGIVVITTGLNELLHSYGKEPPQERAMYGATIEQAAPWIDNFQNRLDEMIKFIGYIFPGGCQIFIANIYDPTDGTGDTNNWIIKAPAWPDYLAVFEAYNQIIQDCVSKYDNVHVVDIHKTFLGHGIHCRKCGLSKDRYCWYQTKSADPSANERGHDAIRRLFLNEMVRVFYDANDGRKVN
ncbi:MAG: SGNH/GDSL hydrolase family protein [Sedimentisphaerales bacterium]